MSQFNYAPVVEFFVDPQVVNAGSNNKSVARRMDVSGLSYISSIAAGSQSMLTVTEGALSVDNLLITDVTVDDTFTTLAAWISNGIPATFKKGDILILSAANPSLTYIAKVETPAAAGDFALMNDGNAYTAGNGLSLAGGAFSLDVGWVRTSGNVFSAGNGISLSGGGAFAADAAWLRGDGNVFTAGTGITNSAGTLALALVAGTGISVSGATITGNYVAGTGVSIAENTIAGDYVAGNGITLTGNSFATNMAKFRFEAGNVSLTANQAYTVTHNLGYKLVQFTALRTSDSARVELEVIYSSTTALSVKSATNLTVDMLVSI